MEIITKLERIKNRHSRFLLNIKSLTLIELILSVIILTTMVLSFYSLESFTQSQVFSADRWSRVQNDLTYVLEHMSKYVQKASGNATFPAVQMTATGFQVRVDFRNTQDPSDLGNTAWVTYELNANTLRTRCTALGSGICGSFPASWESLSDRIISFTPTPGVTPANNIIEIDLVGRFDPDENEDRMTNPQAEMKTKVICNSYPTN